MATFATPGMAISRGRMVHLASVLICTWVRSLEVNPIFITRLSEDSGESMTGARATDGRVATARSRRSCTICRDVITSVDGSRIRTTEESPSTDLDRMASRPGTPLSAASSGTVRSASTSLVDKPGASVCTSTSGGANSGNTSSGVVRSVLSAPRTSSTASATTTMRFWSETPTSQRISVRLRIRSQRAQPHPRSRPWRLRRCPA